MTGRDLRAAAQCKGQIVNRRRPGLCLHIPRAITPILHLYRFSFYSFRFLWNIRNCRSKHATQIQIYLDIISKKVWKNVPIRDEWRGYLYSVFGHCPQNRRITQLSQQTCAFIHSGSDRHRFDVDFGVTPPSFLKGDRVAPSTLTSTCLLWLFSLNGHFFLCVCV